MLHLPDLVSKTRVGLLTIKYLQKHSPDVKTLVVVPTQVLKEQWEKELTEWNLQNCTVSVINTVITHYTEVDFLVLDEIHAFASDAFIKVFDTVDYDMILGLTATLERLDGKEVLIKKYAPVCDRITLKDAEENGWVSPIKNYLVLLDVDLTEYKELDKKFNGYFAFFGWDYNIAMSCLQNWKYRNNYAKQMGVTPKEVMAMSADWMRCLGARKRFIMSHPKKIEICKKILEHRTDKKCITFSATIKDAESLNVGQVIHSKKSKKENSKIIKDFNDAPYGVLCTSKAADVGVDIKGLSVGIIMSVDSSKIRRVQRVGRCIRFEPGKQAEMFTLVIKGTQEIKWFTNGNTGNVITIDEDQLDQVLLGKEINARQQDLISDVKYRF